MILRSNLVRAVGLVALALLLAYAMPAPAQVLGQAQAQSVMRPAEVVAPGVWATPAGTIKGAEVGD